MPAKGAFAHIYNIGIEKRVIFNSHEDYEVFTGFLKDYLTPPLDPKNAKKTFTVNGRSYQGIPHQPKNYFGKVELIAYSLMPNNFHLILHQKTPGTIERFIRSLCTRYSMYFNKKYQRSGTLFQGPYKSVEIKDTSKLLYLTHYLHHNSSIYSSYPEYLGARETPWVIVSDVLSHFDQLEGQLGVSGYKDFVENYTLNQEEREGLEGIAFEKEDQDVEKVLLPAQEAPTEPKRHLRAFEFATATAFFFVLLGLGLRNIHVSMARDESQVLSKSAQIPQASASPLAEPVPIPQGQIVVIRVPEGATSVNIRKEPTVLSEALGKAKDGDRFEFVSENSGWCEVRLANGSTGFILSTLCERL